MPTIEKSGYRAPFLLRNGHPQTVVPTLIRKLGTQFYQREASIPQTMFFSKFLQQD